MFSYIKYFFIVIICLELFIFVVSPADKLGAVRCNSDGSMGFPVNENLVNPLTRFLGNTFTVEAYPNYVNQVSNFNVDLEIQITCTHLISAYSVTGYVSVPGVQRTACFVTPAGATCQFIYTTTSDYTNNCNAFLPNRGFIYTDLVTVKAYLVSNCGSSTGTVTVINPADNPVNVKVTNSAADPVKVTILNQAAPGAELPAFNIGGLLPEFPSLPVTLGNMIPGFSLPTTSSAIVEKGLLNSDNWYKILVRGGLLVVIGFNPIGNIEMVMANNRITLAGARSLQILISPADFGVIIPIVITINDANNRNSMQCWCYSANCNCSDGVHKVMRNNIPLGLGSTITVAQPAGTTSLIDNTLLGYFATMPNPLTDTFMSMY